MVKYLLANKKHVRRRRLSHALASVGVPRCVNVLNNLSLQDNPLLSIGVTSTVV